ncbi:hypothetical protein HZS_6989 [Henneguya salminicola]|nr:hypothetical protein HZS_6989 [Henneguya salminicola]
MKLHALQEKIISQELTLQYLRDQGLISISQRCPKCRNQMILRTVSDEKSSDGEDYSFYSIHGQRYIHQKLLWKISNSRSKR